MYNIFQYLENKKGKPLPLELKLINNLPLNENELTYNDNLDLINTNIKYLPDNLTVNGYLDLYKSKITYLPDNLIVNGWLDLTYTKINSLPDNLNVNDGLWCLYTPLATNIKNDPSLLTKYQKQIKGQIFYV